MSLIRYLRAYGFGSLYAHISDYLAERITFRELVDFIRHI
jgi:hypothetical protein